ncbi:pancreatic lipase-related protein 2-like isoform X2 [Hyla sarda]|uniref:pancreatic lipase-related protein 2-like isoform X2 n=1 Tax=Hyla sarda TaxID=327740 RepID=UPI0024C3E8FD|nr:pancreatic lipase-related protein 2-like isoform X2 [Hyla sarda]
MRDLWLLVVAAIVVSVGAGEICYDQLGCFPNAPPYAFTPQRPIGWFPWPPERINTRYLLFTRENPEHFHEIQALNVSTVSATKFCPKRKSIFIIHGFLEAGENKWLVDMCQVSNVNCFAVDWFGGSVALYTRAVNNARVVGAELANFINYLLGHYRYSLSNIYLIGHSLGAHIAGEAGKRRPGISRISGLDPAGPYFENTPPEVRLDPSDAQLVDVIHTDGSDTILGQGLSGFGMSQLVGHLDFFPNGGRHQPGCPNFYRKLGDLDRVIEGLEEIIFCSHRRSVSFFLNSILHSDGFISYPGPSYSDFQKGAGFPCCNGSCTTMGYYADSHRHDHGSPTFFLNTGDPENLLRWRYKVSVNLTGSTLFMGSFSVSLCGKDCSPQYIIHSGLIQSGRTYSSFFDVEMDVYPVINTVFTWHKEGINLIQPKLGATAMEVQYGPSGAISYFCGKALTEDKIPQTLEPCNMNSRIKST